MVSIRFPATPADAAFRVAAWNSAGLSAALSAADRSDAAFYGVVWHSVSYVRLCRQLLAQMQHYMLQLGVFYQVS